MTTNCISVFISISWSRVTLMLLSTIACCVSDALTLTSGQRIPSRKRAANSIQNIEYGDGGEDQRFNSQKLKSLFDLSAVEDWGVQQGLKEHHLETLYKVVMNSPIPFTEILPEESLLEPEQLLQSHMSLEERLMKAGFPKRHAMSINNAFGYTCSIVRAQESNGGYKFVVSVASGKLVETVLIRHKRNNGSVRYTVCVSSQVGCAKKCSFCATGTMGLQGQLTSGEILEQVFLAKNYLLQLSSTTLNGEGESIEASRYHNRRQHLPQIRNCVFMGMGEPFDNYDEVHEALRGLTHQRLFGLKAKRVTVSTVGASAQKIRKLADEAPQVSLALSLHSAKQESRLKLIPAASANPIDSLGKALDYHSIKNGCQGAMIEYLLIDGVNDSDDEVEALAKFCIERNDNGAGKVFVNLIPYNPTFAGNSFGYETPSDNRIFAFHNRLKELGVNSLVRWSSASGRDANGACGQLVLSPS